MFTLVLATILFRRVFSFRKIHKAWHDFASLSELHKAMLSKYPAHLNNIRKAIETNYQFIFKLISNAVGFFENSDVSKFVSLG